jgi:hypothetical protein
MEPVIIMVKSTIDVKVMYLLLKNLLFLNRSGRIILDLGINLPIISNM